MTLIAQTQRIVPPAPVAGEEMYRWIEELFPICRSITGNGVRETLRWIKQWVPLEIHEVPSGTRVFDWAVPLEWNIRDAYVKDIQGRRLIDFNRSNLHVVSYSSKVQRRMPFSELRPHLYSLPDRPDWIPYRTSYYNENWGFCLSHRDLLAMPEGDYEVCIDSSLELGHLTFGELVLPGRSTEEFLVSCHVCHPSLANDNLSGIAVTVAFAMALANRSRAYTYRFLFIPGTIGAITWLALNQAVTHRIRHGVVLAGLGDSAPLAYKKSRRGSSEIDRAAQHVLNLRDKKSTILDFSPYGYDERQFCSPGFDLPVGRLCRSLHGEFPEYHTSADNLSFVNADSLADALSVCLELSELLDTNVTYMSLNPRCEPQLGRRGLYNAIGGAADSGKRELAMLWILNLSDGSHTLLDIAERSSLPYGVVREAADVLFSHALLAEQHGQIERSRKSFQMEEH